MERPRLEVEIFQIVNDDMFKGQRADGTGFDWCWADWQRDWMNATPSRFAYRCLPLTIVNQTGWWIKNPVGFTATWHGPTHAGGVEIEYDVDPAFWKDWVNNQFGHGIITWNTPFLFRTRPQGSRLLIIGPANYFKTNAAPLTALIESDWMTMSFTMNWKLMAPNVPTRFEVGDPLFQAIPLAGNTCADLESAAVSYLKLNDNPEVAALYNEWNATRRRFHEQKAKGDVKADEWQKDYFRGRDISGREVAIEHHTKLKPPEIIYGPLAAQPRDNGNGDSSRTQKRAQYMQPPQYQTGSRQQRSDRTDGPSRTERDATAVSRAEAVRPSAEEVRPAASTIRVDDEWRRWIAENIMLNLDDESIIFAMVGAGFARQEAAQEIERARRSPYVIGSERLRNRLRKREWLIATYRKINRLHPQSGQIERRHKLSRGAFLADYYSTNRPVILTGMMDDWPALSRWNLDDFAQRFGDRDVEVQFGRASADLAHDPAIYEIEREKFLKTIRFREFLDLLQSSGVTNDFYLTANNTSHNRQVLPELWDDIVQVPEYLNAHENINSFFWMGPAGTITPFHHDLTNNFMAQVLGRKRVKIAPSWDMPLMQNDFHCYSRVDGRVTPARPQPGPGEAQILECILNPGEILFLPIGCLHYVEGVDISVTVSFTNFDFDNEFTSFYTTYHGV